MGALHQGHVQLLKYAVRGRERCPQPVILSIFVNPTQFGPGEDFNRYPRTFDGDCEFAREAGVDVIFAPTVEAVYPDGADAMFAPPLPDVASEPGLEDAHRPGHFNGVCQVVHRFFQMLKPGVAIFGEKDYQQLQVLHAMVAQQHMPIEIVGRPTVRESDGLAMSSRNVYLAPKQRTRALGLSKALCEAADLKHESPADAQQAMRSILLAHQVAIDYAVVRDAETLMPIEDWPSKESGSGARALIAGRVGPVRLIDNAAIVR